MADPVEQLTGVIPVVVTAGVVTKMASGVFGNPEVVSKRRKKSKKAKKNSPW